MGRSHQQESSKELKTLAAAVHEVEQRKGIPRIGLADHVLTQQKSNGVPLFHRYDVKPEKPGHFDVMRPDLLPDVVTERPESADQAAPCISYQKLGALLFDPNTGPDASRVDEADMESRDEAITTLLLQEGLGGLVWELNVESTPPPTLNAAKPKFWSVFFK